MIHRKSVLSSLFLVLFLSSISHIGAAPAAKPTFEQACGVYAETDAPLFARPRDRAAALKQALAELV